MTDAPATLPAEALPAVARLPLVVIAIVLGTVAAILMNAGLLNVEGFVAVQGLTRALPDTAWSMVTICGTGVVAFALLAPTLNRQPRWYAAGLVAAPLAGLYSNGMKRVFALPRPASVLEPGHLHVIGETLRANTFPSGHSVTAFTLAALLVLGSRRPLRAATWAVPMACLIAMSRIAVGAHWPADIAAGAAGGWIAGALAMMVIVRWRRWNTVIGVRVMGVVSIGIGVSLFVIDLGYPLALPLQRIAAVVALAAGGIALARPRLDPLFPGDPSWTDAAPMTMRTLALRGAAVAVSVGLLVWLIADARWQGVGARLARIDPASLAGVALLFAASYAMRGARIHGEFRDEILDAVGRGGSGLYLRVLRMTLVHNALVNVLPFRSGEAAFPVLLRRWFGIGTGRAVVALLWLRTQDATVVLVLAALAWPGLPIAWRALALAVVVAAVVLIPAWARRRKTTSGQASKLRALLERSTRRNAAGWWWTIGNWSAKLVAEAWLVGLALGSTPATALLGAIGAELAAILPIQGVAGFGTFEAGGAVLMRTQGVAMAAGLEAVLVLHAVVLILATGAGALAAALLPGPADPASRRARV